MFFFLSFHVFCGTIFSGTKKKLASIFNKKGKDAPPSDDEVEIIGIEVDPEQQRIRRAFLMSGVPEELKKQKVISETYVLSDYPPIPVISHVQQVPSSGEEESLSQDSSESSGVNPWKLSHVTLPLRVMTDEIKSDVKQGKLPLGCVTSCQEKVVTSTVNKVHHMLQNVHLLDFNPGKALPGFISRQRVEKCWILVH